MKTQFAENGSVLVSVGDTQDQGILVKNGIAKAIGVNESTTDPGKLEFVLDAYGVPKSMPAITNGKIGGVMSFRDQVLAPAIDALDNLSQTAVREINAIHHEGIDAEGLLGGDLLGYTPGSENTAGGMVVLIQDTARVAAAGQFRVTDAPLNPGTAQARINYTTPSYAGLDNLVGDLANAQVPQIATVSLEMPASQGYASVGLVRAGMKEVVLTLNQPGAGQELQVITRDGRHLLGKDLRADADSQSILDRILRSANGFEAGATYNTDQLNAGTRSVNGKTVDDRYLDMDLFIGAKAKVQEIQQFNRSTGALMEPKRMPPVLQASQPAANWLDVISQPNRFTLDGHVLQAADPASPPADLAEWINSQGIAGVTATVDGNGALQITRGDTDQDIRLGMGSGGTAADLKAIGFDTSVYISGTSQDDLLVFVTDTTKTQSSLLNPAVVTAQHEGQSGDIKQMLRNQSLKVAFTKGDAAQGEDPQSLYYTISDSKTDTLLARRLFDGAGSGSPSLHYRGITLEFTTQPSPNDVFTVDGNRDGVGNNEAMLRMVGLEQQKVMNGQTMTEAYIERVNRVGSVARQATISKEALTVVNQQALEAHDGVSGVSLDQEASDLVKFQQAYQANAKVMQVASSLFDAILQVQ